VCVFGRALDLLMKPFVGSHKVEVTLPQCDTMCSFSSTGNMKSPAVVSAFPCETRHILVATH
jgi:hypothetical protein